MRVWGIGAGVLRQSTDSQVPQAPGADGHDSQPVEVSPFARDTDKRADVDADALHGLCRQSGFRQSVVWQAQEFDNFGCRGRPVRGSFASDSVTVRHGGIVNWMAGCRNHFIWLPDCGWTGELRVGKRYRLHRWKGCDS